MLALVVIAASPRGSTYEKKRAKARAEKLQAAQSEMMTALTTYGWVDKAKGVARIPVTDAMKLTVAELAQKKPAPANPIATPAAQSPTPTTSPSPVRVGVAAGDGAVVGVGLCAAGVPIGLVGAGFFWSSSARVRYIASFA